MTGVQTCALPIWEARLGLSQGGTGGEAGTVTGRHGRRGWDCHREEREARLGLSQGGTGGKAGTVTGRHGREGWDCHREAREAGLELSQGGTGGGAGTVTGRYVSVVSREVREVSLGLSQGGRCSCRPDSVAVFVRWVFSLHIADGVAG